MRLSSHSALIVLLVVVAAFSRAQASSLNYDYESVDDYPLARPQHQPQFRRKHHREQQHQHQPVYRDPDYDDEEEEEDVDYEEGDSGAAPQPPASAGDYRPSRDFPRRVYDTNAPNRQNKQRIPAPSAPQTQDDPLDHARLLAKLSIMDRILIALGPDFGETLPKPPNDTLATVPTPINITAEPCPYKYKRCSSETFFPSCDIPHNTDARVWAQKFNLYFNLSEDFERLDIINATLRLYKNNPIPLRTPKPLLIKAREYTRSLTRRRSKTSIVAEKSVSSDYIGWVSLNIEKTVRRWRKARNNHGLQISVSDADTIPWDAASIFVIMNCSSGLVPLPFEVQTDEVGQRYPALNVRQGSPDDEFPASETEGVTEFLQSDDPDVSEDEYEGQGHSHRHATSSVDNTDTLLNNYPRSQGEHIANHHSQIHAAESHRPQRPVYDSFSYGTGSAEKDVQGTGHAYRGGLDQNARSFEGPNPHRAPHHEIPGDYLITNQATNLHHANNPHYGTHHSRTSGHSQHGTVRHHTESGHHPIQSSMEDTIQSQTSEEQMPNSELDEQREPVFTAEPPRSHRRGNGNTKERRYHKKHHHRHPRRGEERNGSAATTL